MFSARTDSHSSCNSSQKPALIGWIHMHSLPGAAVSFPIHFSYDITECVFVRPDIQSEQGLSRPLFLFQPCRDNELHLVGMGSGGRNVATCGCCALMSSLQFIHTRIMLQIPILIMCILISLWLYAHNLPYASCSQFGMCAGTHG